MSTDARALILTPDYPPARGGIQVLMDRIASNFARLEPHVITFGTESAAAFDAERTVRVNRTRPQAGPRAVSIARLNANAVVRAMRWRPSVVLSGHVVTAPAAAVIRRALGVPVVQYVYASELGAQRPLSRFAIAHADAVIAISEYTAGLARGLGAREEQLRLIPVGVDVPQEVRRRPAARPTLLTISRLEERYKGHDVIIRALPLVRARVPDVEWVVVGDGPLRPALQDSATALNLDAHVRFVGAVSDAERDDRLSQSHVFAMPSRLPAGGFAGEGFGIVYLEANAHHLPVIAGDSGGSVDAVVDGETGLLVDAASHLAVADAIVGLLTDPERAAAMGQAGAARAQAFAWPLIAARVEAVLEGMIAR